MIITKESIKGLLEDGGTHRKQFSANTGVQKRKATGTPTFSVPFDNRLVRHFLDGTGLQMKWGAEHKQFYCFLRNQRQTDSAESWEGAQALRARFKSFSMS